MVKVITINTLFERESWTQRRELLVEGLAAQQADLIGLQEVADFAVAEDDMPPELVVELAIAHFLAPDSMTFDDCQIGLQKDRLELLRLKKNQRSTTVA